MGSSGSKPRRARGSNDSGRTRERRNLVIGIAVGLLVIFALWWLVIVTHLFG
jgi:hypothetical protein